MKPCRAFAKRRTFAAFARTVLSVLLCLCLTVQILPFSAKAFNFGYSTTIHGSGSVILGTDGQEEARPSWESAYQYETATSADGIHDICSKYSDSLITTGVRNQVKWMNQLYSAAVQGFLAQLSLGDALLIAILNHSDIITALMTDEYSAGNIIAPVALQIAIRAKGYATVDDVVKATGLEYTEVTDILMGIAGNQITDETIAASNRYSQHTNRGPYLRQRAAKQKKVYDWLLAEVERMAADEKARNRLYEDLGGGYVDMLLSGYKPDQYKTLLYKKHLAAVLDDVRESANPISVSQLNTNDAYSMGKKVRSVISGIYKYETGEYRDELPKEWQDFLTKHLENGVLSESEAREYLILTGEYKAGEHGIGEAAKVLAKGHRYLQKLDKAMETSGKVIKAVDYAKKADELFEYWLTDYAEQELLLDELVNTLADSGANAELMVAAKELQKEYEDKLSGTFDRVCTELMDKGIDTVKSVFPPLGIAEACISLAGMITGADDYVDALETGLAMQGICKQTLADYEAAVMVVSDGDESEEAASHVLATYELARQSLVAYYEAVVVLAGTDAEKAAYEKELLMLQNSPFGVAAVTGVSGGGGSR